MVSVAWLRWFPPSGTMTKTRLLHLFDDKPIRPKPADLYDNAVSALHPPSAVGERHPVELARFGWGALAQNSDLLQGGHDQADPCLRVDQGRLELLIVEYFGFVHVEHLVGKSNHLARLHGLHAERVNSPNELVILARPACEPIWPIVGRNRGYLRLCNRGRR